MPKYVDLSAMICALQYTTYRVTYTDHLILLWQQTQLQQIWHAARVDVQCNAFKVSIGKTLLRVLT